MTTTVMPVESGASQRSSGNEPVPRSSNVPASIAPSPANGAVAPLLANKYPWILLTQVLLLAVALAARRRGADPDTRAAAV